MTEPIDEAAAAALAGGLVVLPTDTVYGIGTRPDEPAAVARLFRAKDRPLDLQLPVLVPDVSWARRIAVFGPRAEALAGRFWPGPLTLVLPRAEESAAWELGGDDRTIGVRIPHHPMTLAVLAMTGPLAVTSANRSGEPTPTTCDELERVFGESVAVYLCEDGPLAGEGTPSTVVSVTDAGLRVLREGSLPAAALEDAEPA